MNKEKEINNPTAKPLGTSPNLRKLSDKDLLSQTAKLIQEERAATLSCLQHLREIEIRRLFVELGYSSMYEMCIKHYKYSEGQTQRRLSAARLLKELPEIESKLESGDLNITTLSKVQTFVRAEKKVQHVLTKENKLELIASLENKSTREAERELVKQSHQPELLINHFGLSHVSILSSVQGLSSDLTPDANLQTLNELGISGSVQYVKFEALLGFETQILLAEFKDLFAHELSDMSDISILKLLLSKALKEKKKKLGLIKQTEKKTKLLIKSEKKSKEGLQTIQNLQVERNDINISEGEGVEANTFQGSLQENNAQLPSAQQVKPLRPYISIAIVRSLWARAQARCEQPGCGSRYALEIDHVEPVALGGGHELSNLRLLCRQHNARRQVRTFGVG